MMNFQHCRRVCFERRKQNQLRRWKLHRSSERIESAEFESELAAGEPEFPEQAESVPEQGSALGVPDGAEPEFGLPVRDYPPESSDSGGWWHYSRSIPDRPRRGQKGWICALFLLLKIYLLLFLRVIYNIRNIIVFCNSRKQKFFTYLNNG
jgi:hypothetical protein